VCSVLNEEIRVPCTSCGYCMPCPHGVDIPSCFSAYNIRCTQGWFSVMLAYVTCTSLKEKPAAASSCVNCGLCERKCPQGILIRDYLDEVKTMMEGRIYRMALPVVKKFLER
ncbi:MAG TPA: 4Fe-4S dicluster domain-containing protein, partial [Methanocorpusculum sp.]|nr:4Fe-4S dicluster domain-containing protein [Methanocorpusculum sp.]